MYKNKWPVLKLQEPTASSDIGEIEELGDSKSGGEDVDLTMEVPHQPMKDSTENANWEVVSSQHKGVKKKFFPVVATRKSFRVAGLHGGDTTSGRPADLSNSPPRNSFTILNSCDDELLEEIASKCEVRLRNSPRESLESLSAMKLEEYARAKMAEANYCYHMEQRMPDTHVLEGENLDLQAIDNKQRGCTELPRKSSKDKRGDKLTRKLKRISIQ